MSTSRSWQMASMLHSTANICHPGLSGIRDASASGNKRALLMSGLCMVQEAEKNHQDWSLCSKTSFDGVCLTYFLLSLCCSSAVLVGQSRKDRNVSLVSELTEHLKFGRVPRWDGLRMIPFCITIPGRAGYVLTLRAGICAVTAQRAAITWYRLPGLLVAFLVWSPSPQYLSNLSGKAEESVTKGPLVIRVVLTSARISILLSSPGAQTHLS